MTPLDDSALQLYEAEDLAALADADAAGFLCGLHEDGHAFAQRLRDFLKNRAKLDQAIENGGAYDCEGIIVRKSDRIGPARFAAIAPATQDLYAFAVDWVPGFYINPACSGLFAGCAFLQYPDFFTLFIIRRNFRNNPRWLIYNRDELLAHELCHVARVGLESDRFEESFAYQTSTSVFRRLLGGMFCRQTDSFLFLGMALLLLLGQIVRTYAWPALPMAPFWIALAAVFGWLFGRVTRMNSQLSRARQNLATVFAPPQDRFVLFRCSDDEIAALAKFRSPEAVREWVSKQTASSLRWKIIARRFPPREPSPEQPC